MKTSELIAQLREVLETRGDLPVAVYEPKGLPVTVKALVTCDGKMTDGHCIEYPFQNRVVLLP